ncbi:MAG: hypothetical protein CVU89_00640 [Firmicutes bacterium HGW-Firmicutes-14]|jgi:uncharacterized protein YnzC (UPF0291/DUF896 family)|nr:MAG: hypothetical protein CVU89_00640 [Firmicutes bacterium HGW-Firmicutes-14]
MKKKLALVMAFLTLLPVISGCSKINVDISKLNPFAPKKETVVQKTYKDTKTETEKTRREYAKEIDSMVNQMVEKINAGDWNSAITIGEDAYAIAEEQAAKAKTVKGAVYDEFGLDSAKEKLYEVLSDAYDYKNHLGSGLTDKEKERFVRTERAHFSINPAEPFKKLALAKVMIDTGNLTEGLKLTTELYNSPAKNKDITESYAWALYLSGKKREAYDIYKTFYIQSETLVQLYHSALVIEEFDKLLGLILYMGCEGAGNNLMVIEPNVKNLSAQTYISKVITDSQKAKDRLLAGGFRIDSQYNLEKVEQIIKSIVTLSEEQK